MKDAANNIRNLRKRLGWSGAELAEKANLSKSLVSQIETGSKIGGIQTLLKIADALGVRIEDLGVFNHSCNFDKLDRDEGPGMVKISGASPTVELHGASKTYYQKELISISRYCEDELVIVLRFDRNAPLDFKVIISS